MSAFAEPPPPADAISYDAAVALAKEAKKPAELTQAVHALTALMPDYPQDVELPLQLGWVLSQLAQFSSALQAYEIALSRSAPGGDAELGVALSLLRLGRCAQARGHFQSVLTLNPFSQSAAAGLQSCAQTVVPPPALSAPPAKLWLQPLLAQIFYAYQNHPAVKYAAAPLLRLDALWRSRFYAALAYRYTYFAPPSSQIAPWSQHDVFVNAGYTTKSVGSTLHYGVLIDKSGYSGTSHHIGLSGRYSFGWDALLNLSASVFQDAPVLRAEVALRVPIISGFSLRPGGAVQWMPNQTFTSLMLGMFYDHRRYNLWLGGKVGGEKRAVYFNVAYVYNGPAIIPYGAWLGGSVSLGAGFAALLNYTYDRLERIDTTPIQDSHAHSLTLALTREF